MVERYQKFQSLDNVSITGSVQSLESTPTNTRFSGSHTNVKFPSLVNNSLP